jgi:hypothetical protein
MFTRIYNKYDGFMIHTVPAFCLSALGFLLKGQCNEIFNPRFFSSINPPRALIHRLNPFRIWLRIRREIRFGNRQIGFHGVKETVEFFAGSSPLTFTFSSNYNYVMYVFVIAIVSL